MSWTELKATPLLSATGVAVSSAMTYGKFRIRGFMARAGATNGTLEVRDGSAATGSLMFIVPLVSGSVEFLSFQDGGFRTSTNHIWVSVGTSVEATLIYDGG